MSAFGNLSMTLTHSHIMLKLERESNFGDNGCDFNGCWIHDADKSNKFHFLMPPISNLFRLIKFQMPINDIMLAGCYKTMGISKIFKHYF